MKTDEIINKIKEDLKEMTKKHINSNIIESKELIKKEVYQYFEQIYTEPKFDIEVKQDPNDDSVLIVNARKI